MAPGPTISVIVPAYNAETVLPRCLDAILASDVAPHEVVVVDDGSTDGTAQLARRRGLRLLATEGRKGPGAARNLAAQEATGEVLLFVDSDVIVRRDTVGRVRDRFARDERLAAVFGSYDDAPEQPDFLSQYKNLQHHWVHQNGNEDAVTFWAGCGAMRREIFLELGGFDVRRFPEPSIEDIELGYRLKAAGHRIALDKQLCVKHLKQWRFWPLLRTEIVCRAAPWSRLILESELVVRDLNVRNTDRVSAVLVWLGLGLLAGALLRPPLLVPAVLAFAVFVALNRGFYGFFLRRRGLLFTLRVIPMHALYYLYSSATFAACALRSKLA